MRALIQYASQATVTINDETVGELSRPGLVILLGINTEDTEEEATLLAEKIYPLRILPGETSVATEEAPVLVISQFTLYADVRKGRRPSWSKAAPGSESEPLYEFFISELRRLGAHVETGRFGAMMDVSLTNSGPVTVLVDSDELKQPRRQH